ncbi:hypothetical protein PC121_g23375 [Phytophthora cactorum]|nr:hypothetical protein PC120_g25514 [Phytophthora cactorum]KAG3041446.1 hypothetical protein PC121_g23375 [Phytophthora cactorum]KAG4038239.1 hypothetical protein PC123_g26195 [Phytophthora cactorum]
MFGCHTYVTVPKEKWSKFDARAVRYRFLGYSEHEKAYRFEEIKRGRVLVSRDAQFMEDVFDGGRRSYDREVVVELKDEEATDQEASSEDDTKENTARNQDVEPGSKATPANTVTGGSGGDPTDQAAEPAADAG